METDEWWRGGLSKDRVQQGFLRFYNKSFLENVIDYGTDVLPRKSLIIVEVEVETDRLTQVEKFVGFHQDMSKYRHLLIHEKYVLKINFNNILPWGSEQCLSPT